MLVTPCMETTATSGESSPSRRGEHLEDRGVAGSFDEDDRDALPRLELVYRALAHHVPSVLAPLPPCQSPRAA